MDRSGRLFSVDEGLSGFSNEVGGSNTPQDEPPHRILSPGEDEILRKLEEAARSDPDFADVILAARLYGIPSKAISGIGIKERDFGRDIYTVGAGLTAEVVQHTMSTGEGNSVTGKTIALKIFQSTRLASPNQTKAARQKVYQSILKEMIVFRNPSLSSHPNILRLLFVGWNLHQPYPMLATELGDHGSLDYILRTYGPGPTVQQKRNITVDIAEGLLAIHNAGMTHGDLKPDNIIVFSHADPTRQIMAKLADFGGSSMIYTKEQFVKPTHFTPLWCAPEALGKERDIPWHYADLYSYGLVVASLWVGSGDSRDSNGESLHGNQQEAQGVTILSGFVSLASDQHNEGLEYIKSLPENHPDSVMSILKKRLTKESLPAGIDPSELFAILTPALRTNWWDRPDREDFMAIISDFAHTFGRAIAPLAKRENFSGYEPEATRPGLFRQTFEQFVTMTEYRDIVTKHIAGALDEINSRIQYVPEWEDLPSHLPRDLSMGMFLEGVLAKTEKGLQDLYNAMGDGCNGDIWPNMIDFIKKGYFSYQLGVSHMSPLRPGPVPGLRASAVEYIRTSALHEHAPGMRTACFALADRQAESNIPVRLNLVLLALAHCSLALRRLHFKWPDLYAMVRNVLRERGLGCLEDAKAICPHLHQRLRLVKLYCDQPAPLSMDQLVPLTLNEALEVGAGDAVRDLLEDPSYDITTETEPRLQTVVRRILPPTLEDSEGFAIGKVAEEAVGGRAEELEPIVDSLFHRLGKLPDVEAGALARTAYHRGARLGYLEVAPMTDMPMIAEYLKPYSPLCVALMRGQPMLAMQIIYLHVEFDAPISQFYTAMLLSLACLYPEVTAVLHRLVQDNPAMCTSDHEDIDFGQYYTESPARGLSSIVLELGFELTHWGTVMLHGGGYEAAYIRTLRFVLDEGAGPAWGPPSLTPLGLSICADDITAVKIYIDHLEMLATNCADVDMSDVILAVLNDPCNMISVTFRDRDFHDEETFPTVQYMYSALALCLRHGSLQCFEFFLTKAPSLATAEVDFLQMTLLHRACCGIDKLESGVKDDEMNQLSLLTRASNTAHDSGVEFVDLLLRAGADVMATDDYGHTPLYWALARANLGVADRILSYCSQDQVDLLLGRNPRTGVSIFVSLVRYHASGHTGKEDEQRQPRLVESLRWLVERGAVYYHDPEACPPYHLIILKRFRFDRIDQLRDAALVEYLIELPLYAEGLQADRCGGAPVIYLAVLHGNVEIVRLLLDRNCDVNGGYYDETQAGDKEVGTPLDFIPLALLRGWHDLCETQREAGKAEFRQRQDCMLDIANLLIDRGGVSARFDVKEWMNISSNQRNRSYTKEVIRDPVRSESVLKQQAVLGAWPKPLPSHDEGFGVAAATTAVDPRTDKNLTYYLFQAAYTRMKEKRRGRSGVDRRLLLIEDYYADAVGDPPLGRGSTDATSESSQAKGASTEDGETGPPDRVSKLHAAVRDVDVAGLMDALDAVDNVDAEDDKGLSPLDCALQIRSTHMRALMVQLLLQAGANPDRVHSSSSSLSTPLHRSIRRRDDPEVVRILATAGASVDILNALQHSPLRLAVDYGREEALSALLAAGADITQRSAEGQTLIHLATMYGNARILSRLLEFLRSEKAETINERLVNAKITESLGGNDASLPKRHGYFQPGHAPMHIAAHPGLIRSMRILINEGRADPNVRDAGGMTPLHHAVSNSAFKAVRILIDEAGVDINAQDNEGVSPLVLWVIKYGREQGRVDTRIRDLLLTSGANIHDLAEFRFFKQRDDEHVFSYHHVTNGKETVIRGSDSRWVEWDPWIIISNRQ